MSTRSTRNQPWCWQEKKVLRLLRKSFSGNDLVKYKSLYLALTEIDSDFNGKPIQHYTKTISTYSGLSVKWIPSALQKLREYSIIEITEERNDKGHVVGRELIFTPDRVTEIPNMLKPDIRKPDVRKPNSRILPTLEDNKDLLEDNKGGEEAPPRKIENKKPKGGDKQVHDEYLNPSITSPVPDGVPNKVKNGAGGDNWGLRYHPYYRKRLKERRGLDTPALLGYSDRDIFIKVGNEAGHDDAKMKMIIDNYVELEDAWLVSELWPLIGILPRLTKLINGKVKAKEKKEQAVSYYKKYDPDKLK